MHIVFVQGIKWQLIKFLKFLLQRISTLGHIVRLTISGICEIKTRKWSDRKKIFFFCSRIKKDIQIFSLSSPLRSTIISIFNTKLYLTRLKSCPLTSRIFMFLLPVSGVCVCCACLRLWVCVCCVSLVLKQVQLVIAPAKFRSLAGVGINSQLKTKN